MWAAWAEVYPERFDDFWNQTPRTFLILMHAAQKRRIYETDLVSAGSWTTAALSRAEKMPKLTDLMINKPKPKPKTYAEMRAEFERFTEEVNYVYERNKDFMPNLDAYDHE